MKEAEDIVTYLVRYVGMSITDAQRWVDLTARSGWSTKQIVINGVRLGRTGSSVDEFIAALRSVK